MYLGNPNHLGLFVVVICFVLESLTKGAFANDSKHERHDKTMHDMTMQIKFGVVWRFMVEKRNQ